MSRIHIKTATTIWAVLFAVAGEAATVTWTVTNSGEGHAVVIPTNAQPQMDTIIAQSQSYLNANTTNTLVLYFPPGTYYFNNTNSVGILINTFTNGSLVLSGAGTNATTLVFEQFDEIGIKVEYSSAITVEQMLLTRSGLYVTQGTVITSRPGLVHFQLQPGFPDPVWLFNLGNSSNQERTLIGYTHDDPLDPHMDPIYDKVELSDIVSNGAGSVTLTNNDGSVSNVSVGQYDAILADTNEVPPWPVGEWVAQKCKSGAHTLEFSSCNDGVVQDVRFTCSSENSLRAIGTNNNMLVQRVTIDRGEPINGVSACFSSPAGGPQIYCGPVGATIRNCVIIGTADDGIGYFPAVPPATTNDGVLIMPANGVIEGNTVRDNQARGIVIASSAGGICEGNTLLRNDEASILMDNFSSDVENYTNASVRNWTIANNALIEAWVNPVIFLTTQCTNAGLHDNITIESNSFIEAPKDNNLVYVDNANKIQINNNTITSFSDINDFTVNPDVEAITWNSTNATNALIYVKKGAMVYGTNNTYLQSIYPTNRLVSQQSIATDVVSVAWSFLPTPSLQVADIDVANASGNAQIISVEITNLQPGNICRFWKSTDLVDWQDQGAVFATNIQGASAWTENVTNQPTAFYRASW